MIGKGRRYVVPKSPPSGEPILQVSGAETDGRLLAATPHFSRGWNLVDFLTYLVGYLQTNQPVMILSGVEVGNFGYPDW